MFALWPEFWSQCSKDFAAKNGEPAAPEKATSKKAPEKSAKTAAVDESDSSDSGELKKACDAKWGSYRRDPALIAGTTIFSSWSCM